MDEIETLVSEPTVTEARHCALGLLKHAKITQAPVILNQILKEVSKTFDVSVLGATESEMGTKIDAVTKREGKEVYILYNKTRHVYRQRFSFAHELGHLNMGHVHGNRNINMDINSKDSNEILANEFAATLLMPPAFLRKDIKSGMKDVRLLAEKYQVSEEAMWWQIEKSGLVNSLIK